MTYCVGPWDRSTISEAATQPGFGQFPGIPNVMMARRQRVKIGQRIDGDKWVIGYGDGKIVTVDANNTIGFMDDPDWLEQEPGPLEIPSEFVPNEPPPKKASGR